jgi:D-sorbitol dehydrogenase (acceptor)
MRFCQRPIGEKKASCGRGVPADREGILKIAGLRCFLASSDSDYAVAQTLNVDGGNWMS